MNTDWYKRRVVALIEAKMLDDLLDDLAQCCLEASENGSEAAKRIDELVEAPLTVKVSYFKRSGKWYADGEYKTSKQMLWDIWQEARLLDPAPGLSSNSHEFDMLIEVPGHPFNVPHMMRRDQEC